MRKAGWIILIVLVAALIFGIYTVLKMPDKNGEPVVQEEIVQSEFVLKTVEEDIVKITLENVNGEFCFEKENGQWMSVFGEKVKTEGNAIVALESMVKKTLAIEEIEKSTSSLEMYGLNPPVAALYYVTESGKEGFLKIGKNVAGTKTYFTVDDENVYTMDAFEAGYFSVSMEAFANMNLMNADIQYVSKINIIKDGREIIVEQKKQSEITEGDANALFGYALRSPVAENASNSAVQKLLQEISNISAKYYDPYIDDEEAGITESLNGFAVTAYGKENRFILGNKVGEDSVYVKKEGIKGVYTVPLEILGFMDYTTFDLIDKHIALYYIDEISCIRIEASDEVYEFMLGTNKTLNDKTVEEETVVEFYKALVGLSYDDNVTKQFASEEIKPEITIIFYKNGKKDVTEYIPYDAMSYAVRRNGVTELTIQRKYLEKILSLVKEM